MTDSLDVAPKKIVRIGKISEAEVGLTVTNNSTYLNVKLCILEIWISMVSTNGQAETRSG